MAPRRRRPLSTGALAGAVASLAVCALQAVLRLGLDLPSAAELIGDRVAERVPVRPFLDVLDALGGYNRVKALSVAATGAGTLALGTVGGALYARSAERQEAQLSGRPGPPSSAVVKLVVAVTLAWAVVAGALWPLLGTYAGGERATIARAANLAALGLAAATYAGVLVLCHRLILGAHDAGPDQASPDRRAVLVSGAGMGLAVATGGMLVPLYRRSTLRYDGLQVNGDIAPITPNDRFYIVTQNLIDPAVDRSSWRLDVAGHVERSRRYDFAGITALPAVEQETTLCCISNPVGGGLMSNGRWRGTPLAALLQEAGVRPGARDVVLRGVDGYADTIPIAKALDPTTLVAYQMNGQPLPRRHGFPARVLVPGLYGEKSVKWVTAIEVSAGDEEGFYEHQGWGPDFTVKTRSRFTGPALDRPLPMGPVTLRGTAFAGDRGVSRVEVSVDDGATWGPARLDYAPSRLTWALWSFPWQPERPGEHRLVVRAVDGVGASQAAQNRDIAPEGATGYHRVTVTVR